jgi:PAS domain S-box-containing protein
MTNPGTDGPPHGSFSVPGVEIEPSIDEAGLARLFGALNADFVILVSPEGRFLQADPDTLRALGYTLEEFAALNVWDVCPISAETWPARVARLRQSPSSRIVEARTRSGGLVPSSVEMRSVTLSGQEYVVCTARQAHMGEPPDETAIVWSTESSVPVVFVLTEGRAVDSTRAGADVFGAPSAQIAAELESAIANSSLLQERAQTEAIPFLWHSRRRDQSSFTIEATLSTVSVGGRSHMLAVLVDLSTRRKPERTMAQLAGRLLEARDAERKRVARELHNHAGQNISALAINLSLILSSTRGLDAATREALEESIRLADACVREIRGLSYQLHPPLLGELGLVAALRVFAESYTARTGIKLAMSLPSPAERLPAEVEIGLFRIIEEGLENVRQHSGSDVASVILKIEPGRVEMELADEGKGLPPGTLEWDGWSEVNLSIGIAGMRARARRLGGHLSFGSGPDGTTLRVAISINAAA